MKKANVFAVAVTIAASLLPANHASAAEACAAGLVEANRMTVQVEGEGPDVVLIPGLSSPRAVWEPTAARLKGKYRLHLVQVRGFGDAAGVNAEGPVLDGMVGNVADYIHDCITAQGRAAPAVIGHSMGGLTAMMIAARVPQEVGKLMVVDSLPFIGLLFGPTVTVEMVKPQVAALQQILAARPNAEADERTLQTMSATDAGRAQVKAWTVTANAKVSAQLFYDVATTDLRPELGAITAPMTMLYPFDASVMSADGVDALYKGAFTGATTATLTRIDASRHFIMLDQPDAFAKAVDSFLAE